MKRFGFQFQLIWYQFDFFTQTLNIPISVLSNVCVKVLVTHLRPQYREFPHDLQLSRYQNYLSFRITVKSPWSSRQCVGLLDEQPGFEFQARHQNEIRKVFLRRFPLSRFLAKTLRVNKNCHEKFLKKSVVRSRL